MSGAPRSGQRGWSTCTPSRVHIPDVLSANWTLKVNAQQHRANFLFARHSAEISSERADAPLRRLVLLAHRPTKIHRATRKAPRKLAIRSSPQFGVCHVGLVEDLAYIKSLAGNQI
jgi:hypothetical protein